MPRPFTFDRTVRILFTIAVLFAALWLLNVLKGVLLPFLVACLVAYMLEPVVQWNARHLHLKRRFFPVVLTLLEAMLIVGGCLMAFIPYLISEATEMSEMIRTYATTQVHIPYISDRFHEFLRENIDFNRLTRLLSEDEWRSLIKSALSSSWSFLTSSVAFVAGAVSWLVVLLYIVFIMLDYPVLMLSFRQLIPHSHRDKVSKIFTDVENSMNKYFRGQALIAFLVGILFAIGFLIIGLPMGVVLGLFIGLLNMVPYLQLVSLPITALLCLVWTVSTGGDFWLIFWEAMAVYVIVQGIQDLLLTPKIMGKAMNLNPAIILLSLSIWGCLLGFIGLIIALPLTTLLLSYYNEYVIDRIPKEIPE